MAMPKGLAAYWRKKRGKKQRRKGGYRMAKTQHRSKKMTIPLAVVGGFVPVVVDTMSQGGTWQDKAKRFCVDMTGYNMWAKRFTPKEMLHGLVPVLAGFMVHKFVGGTLGINRLLANANVPLFRL